MNKGSSEERECCFTGVVTLVLLSDYSYSGNIFLRGVCCNFVCLLDRALKDRKINYSDNNKL